MLGTSSRRRFLVASTALVCHAAVSTKADELPKSQIRATDGDPKEPDWKRRLTIRVGVKDADLNGTNEKVIQAACDYVARMGGGTVQILPGVYTFRNSVYLPSNIRIVGSGPETILTKGPSESVDLTADSDWYDQQIKLAKSSAFRVGDGVVLFAKNPHNGSQEVIKRTLVAQSGNTFKLNNGLRKNLWLSGKPRCASVFPLLTSEYTSDVVIENLTIDGNGKENENLNGNYGGCIFLQDCNRYTFRNVETRNYNGDGISFQICHDVRVENCHSHDNANLGLHPGSGSQRPVIVGSRMENNTIGLFWCWGVRFGRAENNKMIGNRSYGISIGHNDTDNVMRNNLVKNSGQVGILFRDDSRGLDFWANRNLVENNKIINSGGESGVAIDIRGKTKDIAISNNQLSETRGAEMRVGIRIAAQTERIRIEGNEVTGFAQTIVRDA